MEHVLEKARQKTIALIFEFRILFKHSTMFMIRKKYSDLDLFYVDLT